MKQGLKTRIRRNAQKVVFCLTSAKFVNGIFYKYRFGKKLNLKNPQAFSEKIQWLKIYEWPNNPTAIQCGDKYTVRKYVEDAGLGDTLNELLFVWESVDDIDWDALPDQFALKCTHGCGYNIICSDKSKLDIKEAKKNLKRWMREDYGKISAELHYSKMKPRIICEKFLGGNMTDYKFYICNGKYCFMYIAEGFGSGIGVKITFFDENGEKAPYRRTDYPVFDGAKLPADFEKMKEYSLKLAEGLPFLRVDWFEVDGKIYFGEMTFTPCGGLMRLEPMSADKMLGDMLDISDLMEKAKK